MRAFLWLLSLVILSPFTGKAQTEGCTDPKALNYNSVAVVNNGTCYYKPQYMRPRTVVKELNDSINETSGLIYWRESYWTHNDSEGGAVIYRLDQRKGHIIQRVSVSNAENIDWEDITQDERFIYIGDFGNNLGSRKDLVIYRIDKSAIPSEENISLEAERIAFSYGDQVDFEVRNRKNDHDCESMISFGDSLYLFSKNWVSHTSRLYALPKVPGRYTIFPLDEFNTDGLITGAAIDAARNEMVLCGYRNYVPFVWVMNDFRYNDFFGGNKRRIDFIKLAGAQTEGVTETSEHIYIISSEKTAVNKAKLFKLDLRNIL